MAGRQRYKMQSAKCKKVCRQGTKRKGKENGGGGGGVVVGVQWWQVAGEKVCRHRQKGEKARKR